MVLEMGVLDLSEKEDLDKLDKVVDIVLNWNTNYIYDRKKYNCQLFCSEILEALDLSLKTFKGQLSNLFFLKKETFFDVLNTKGKQGNFIKFIAEMSYICPYDKKKYFFNTHKGKLKI
jgi:hypothetical protein